MRYSVDRWIDEAGAVGDTISAQLESAALASPQWAKVQAQLTTEGITDPISLLGIKGTFTGAFQSLVSPENGFGLASDPSSALDAAAQLTIVGQTTLGAVNTVGGLIHDLSTESVPQIAQAFTGGLIALAVGAGAISAGIGAAIVGAVGELLSVMASAGLFGPPAGVQLQGCSGSYYNPPPQMAVGCVAGYCDPNVVQVEPGSSNWRSFPRPGNAADSAWFFQTTPARLGVWKGVEWWWPSTQSPYFYGGSGQSLDTRRPIDVAFPNYNWVERGATPQGFGISISPFASGSAFLQGFASAWRANAEYALNGLKPSDDPSVLLQFLRFWNRAHSGPTFTMYQDGTGGSYAEHMVTAVVNHAGKSDKGMLSSDGGVIVNGGARRIASAAAGVTTSRSPYRGALVSSVAPSTGNTLALVGVGALGLVALTKPALLSSWLRRVGIRL